MHLSFLLKYVTTLLGMLLTQMDYIGELHVATASVLIDATHPKTVVAFTRNAVTGNFSRGDGLRGEAFLPLLRTNLLSLKDKHGASGSLAVGRRLPGEESTVGSVYVHFDTHRTDWRAVSGCCRTEEKQYIV